MKLKFPTVNCPVRTVSISDLWKGNESCSARLPSVRQGSKCYSCQGGVITIMVGAVSVARKDGGLNIKELLQPRN